MGGVIIMKTGIIVLLLLWGAAIIVPSIAQVSIPFYYWPTLYAAAENAVVKRGTHRDGADNDLLYVRIGWGPCLGIRRGEFRDFWYATKKDRYINVRAYASSQVEAPGGWNEEHEANCPFPPMEVKPYWRDSRPVYYAVWSETERRYFKNAKTDYRVSADSADIPLLCTGTNAHKSDGDTSNYFALDGSAQVYDETGSFDVDDLVMPAGHLLATVCREQDVDLLDYRF